MPPFKKVKPMSFTEKFGGPRDKERPRVSLPIAAIPVAKKWEIGRTYEVGLKVVQQAINDKEVTFEVVAVAAANKQPTKKQARRYA